MQFKSSEARLKLAEHVAHRVGDFKRATRQFEKAASLRSRSSQVHLSFGVFQELCLKQEEEAMKSYSRAIDLRSDCTAARVNLASLLQRRGRLSEALDQLAMACELTPDHLEARLRLAHLLLCDLSNLKDAFAHLRLALLAHPTSAEGHINSAACFSHPGPLHDIQRARVHLCQAVHLDPLNYLARFNLAVLLHTHYPDQPTDALNSYLAAISIGPCDPQIFELLAELFRSRFAVQPGLVRQVVLELIDSGKIPSSMRALVAMAEILCDICQDHLNARTLLLRGLELDPDSHHCHLLLAKINASHLQNPETAYRHVKAALSRETSVAAVETLELVEDLLGPVRVSSLENLVAASS
eukprot:m.51746 g.51746  ORF g.51746 m.51746 type:complete len:355 (+) comp48340_c0_seq1:811-1875(+)